MDEGVHEGVRSLGYLVAASVSVPGLLPPLRCFFAGAGNMPLQQVKAQHHAAWATTGTSCNRGGGVGGSQQQLRMLMVQGASARIEHKPLLEGGEAVYDGLGVARAHKRFTGSGVLLTPKQQTTRLNVCVCVYVFVYVWSNARTQTNSTQFATQYNTVWQTRKKKKQRCRLRRGSNSTYGVLVSSATKASGVAI